MSKQPAIERDFKSWRDFESHLSGFFDYPASVRGRFFFRGQPQAKWQIETTLDRYVKAHSLGERNTVAKELLDQFDRECGGLLAALNLLELDPSQRRLVARHHGLPSTIIDFTASPYVACFFAFSDPVLDFSDPDDRVAVWALDTEAAFARLADNVVAIDAVMAAPVNPRATEQQARFLDMVHLVDFGASCGDALRKLTLPVKVRTEVLDRLESMGLTWRSLFRDADNAARTAAWRTRILHQKLETPARRNHTK